MFDDFCTFAFSFVEEFLENDILTLYQVFVSYDFILFIRK